MDILDEVKNTYPIDHHGKWVLFNHPFVAKNGISSPIWIPKNQLDMVSITVEGDYGARGLYVIHHPQYGCVVQLVEGITHIIITHCMIFIIIIPNEKVNFIHFPKLYFGKI